jgi:OOP family OmpA-OmpF porin
MWNGIMCDHILTQIPPMPIPTLYFLILQGLVSAALVIAAHEVRAANTAPGYVQDATSTIVRSGSGTCWHAGPWSMADAVVGCDGVLQSPVARVIAPPLLVVVPPEQPPAPPPAQRCDYSLTLAGDDTFDFDDTTLKQPAKAHIDAQLLEPLSACTTERISVTGHADRLGTSPYNQRLSEKRANIVAAYLAGKGVVGNFDIRGAGSSEFLAPCDGKMSLPVRIVCLAPNRRVVIKTFGIRSK